MARPQTRSAVLDAASSVGGAVLGAVFSAVAAVRRRRPLHTVGSSHRATLTINPTAERTGVPLLDTAATHDIVARVSRASSFTTSGPDVQGLALHLPTAGAHGGPADVLLASTGLGVVTRHVLAVRREASDGPLTTLLPSASPTGALVLALVPDATDPARYDLRWSRPGRAAWTTVGTLELGDLTDDPGHLDPTCRPLADLLPAPWVRRLRDPAYRAARTVLGNRR